jgi:hypothetical protein
MPCMIIPVIEATSMSTLRRDLTNLLPSSLPSTWPSVLYSEIISYVIDQCVLVMMTTRAARKAAYLTVMSPLRDLYQDDHLNSLATASQNNRNAFWVSSLVHVYCLMPTLQSIPFLEKPN